MNPLRDTLYIQAIVCINDAENFQMPNIGKNKALDFGSSHMLVLFI